jgi:hypothetical protein
VSHQQQHDHRRAAIGGMEVVAQLQTLGERETCAVDSRMFSRLLVSSPLMAADPLRCVVGIGPNAQCSVPTA